MKRTGIIQIDELITEIIDKNKLNDGLDKVRVKEIWSNVVGVYIARCTTEINIYGNKLVVSVNSSIVRNELQIIKSEIVKRINKDLHREFINEIILR